MGLKLGQLLVGHSLSLCSIPCACISCRQDKFWVKSFVDGYVEGIVDNYTVTAYIYTRRDGVLDINVRASKYLISNADIAQKVIDKYRNYVR